MSNVWRIGCFWTSYGNGDVAMLCNVFSLPASVSVETSTTELEVELQTTATSIAPETGYRHVAVTMPTASNEVLTIGPRLNP